MGTTEARARGASEAARPVRPFRRDRPAQASRRRSRAAVALLALVTGAATLTGAADVARPAPSTLAAGPASAAGEAAGDTAPAFAAGRHADRGGGPAPDPGAGPGADPGAADVPGLGLSRDAGLGGAAQMPPCGVGVYQAEAVRRGDTWTAPGYTGSDMLSAMRSAVASLDRGRGGQQAVVVRGSGTVPADQSLDLPSHTVLEVCGSIAVTGSLGVGHAPVRIRNVTAVEVRSLRVTGVPYFGVLVRDSTDVRLGRIDLRLAGGRGVRIDNHAHARRAVGDHGVRIDQLFVSGGGGHAVQALAVDGLRVGSVTTRDTARSGLLLKGARNVSVGRVDGEGRGAGTGYAAFRLADLDGGAGVGRPVSIRVDEVIARGGGGGVRCGTEGDEAGGTGGGAEIGRIVLVGGGGDAALIDNCRDVDLAAVT